MWISKKKLDKLIWETVHQGIDDHKSYDHCILEPVKNKPYTMAPDFRKHELDDVVQHILNYLAVEFETTERTITLVNKGSYVKSKRTKDSK